MDVSGVRKALLELTRYYFRGATVTFSRQSKMAKQGVPLVTLYTGVVTRPINPPQKVIDGRPVSFYPSSVPVQIDLFTKGRKVDMGEGFTPVMENTAVDDLLAFVNFLNSEFVAHYCEGKDIAIVIPNTVEDLTGLINDTSYEYRAMVEITVYFTQYAIGYSGSLSDDSVVHGYDEHGNPITGGDIQADDVTELDPAVSTSPSGGGNPEVLGDERGYFENVEINDKLVKEENQ